MSHFFENLDTDLSVKKNAQKVVGKTKQKKDKIAELETELENMQINHKNIDGLIKDLKQHHKKFAKEGLPAFLQTFLENCASDGNSKIKSQVTKYLSQYKTKNEEKEINIENEVQIQKTKVDTTHTSDLKLNEEINKIITKDDQKTQEDKLVSLLAKTEKNNQKAKIQLTLLTIYIKKSNFFDKAIETINSLVNMINDELIFYDIDMKKIIVNNIDTYIGFLLPFVNEERKNKFEKIIETVTFLNEEKIHKKKLIYNYFILENNSFVDKGKEKEGITGDEVFDLLYLIRNKKYNECVKYYKNSLLFNKPNHKIENKYDTNYNISCIINELGVYAFKEKEYKFAFDLLQKSYMNGIHENENLLYILCMILEDEIVDEYFYDEFYENLRCIDENPYLLESMSEKEEIFRAYFYLVNYDIDNCVRIMEKVAPELECREIFMDRIRKSLEKEIYVK